jgi:hypothetical protein
MRTDGQMDALMDGSEIDMTGHNRLFCDHAQASKFLLLFNIQT